MRERCLAGKVALISGAARGQGAAEAEMFVTEGAAVVLGDVLVDEVQALAQRLGGAAYGLELDVTEQLDWEHGVAVATDHFGGLDVLVNNAGIASAGAARATVADLDPDAWRRILDVNLTGNFLGIGAAAAELGRRAAERRAHGEPTATSSIVNISSAQAFLPTRGNAAYAASKWGQRGLTRTAALDLSPLVRVNSVHPGPIDTQMIADADPAVIAHMLTTLPLGRVGTVDDVARLVLFLASDDSSFCTGGEFPIEGGRLAGS